MKEKIEILGLDIFAECWREIEFVEQMKECLNKDIGWHYFLDLAWMMREVSCLKKGSLILDAGGGNGLAQFILAEMGYNVVNADFANPVFSRRVKDRYGDIMFHLNDPGDVTYDNRYTRHLLSAHNIPIGPGEQAGSRAYISSREEAGLFIDRQRYRPKDAAPVALNGAIPYSLKYSVSGLCGCIYLYKCDLKRMDLIPDNFFDGVVSISALEHNDHEDFLRCVDELERITKEGGKMAITVSASREDDWFHEPSKGWCYSEATLRELFRLPHDAPGNYSRRDKLFSELRKQDNELHKRLAPFHFRSGQNGMPWGVWDPQYQPVGVVKIKEKRLQQTGRERKNGAGAEAIGQSSYSLGGPADSPVTGNERSLTMGDLENGFTGKRCFIIGNGPSLRTTDLRPLASEYTIGLNRIYLNYENMGFEPTFYCAVNLHVLEQFSQEIDVLNSIKFLRSGSEKHFRNRRNTFFMASTGDSDFVENIGSLRWCEGWTVTYCAMQVAFSLGFHEVVLVGVDHSFPESGEPNTLVTACGSDHNHFHPDYFGRGVRWQYPDLERSEQSYATARRVYEKNGRRIIDATIGGKLRVFPRVDYHKVISGPRECISAFILNREGEELYHDGDSSGAMSAFAEAVRMVPGYATAWNNLGVLHWHNGTARRASECFAKALHIDPDNRDVVINCCRILAEHRGVDQAKKLITSYCERHGDDEELALMRDAL